MDLLSNTVRPYAWGSPTALPELMGTVPDGTPQAELWMGAHPAAPSRVSRGGRPSPLDEVIAADPGAELGDATVRRFGPRLPFLLKLLAADAPLSLQVHPDAAQAAAGYARENAAGVPLDAPHRTYRDAHHKPEMIVALSPFEGLCGFRPARECAELLDALGVAGLAPYAHALRSGTEEDALREVFSAFLTSPDPALLAEVTRALGRVARGGGAWGRECAVYEDVARVHPGDPGVLAALMVRQVRLAPGEALFLGAGVPHAYLRGLGVEVMAGSDNVLRCGLTTKHVDVEELLRVVRFAAGPTGAVRPVVLDGGEEVYPAPVGDFRLSRLRPGTARAAYHLDGAGPQILVCTHGRVRLAGREGELALGPGASAYVPAGEEIEVTGDGTVFRATATAG
ncbi:mannose-6-phosphate isomerase, class I [Streptomyces sp. TRM76323]|uniref:mannose-6-phosphate isomerase n=1 Tax=Streptomyces tamarix TaxID=3078565 RepID=A0ABU3QN87_9ACTN|nr:mannose-6-phosphate isomerase, class I [Streptomyces tamarix]MDT9684224.1 mannose-6-phosphate isomerase, class I [Streptomyces tamarix]